MTSLKVHHVLYAGSSLAKAPEIFAVGDLSLAAYPVTMRQRTQVLEYWPKAMPELGPHQM